MKTTVLNLTVFSLLYLLFTSLTAQQQKQPIESFTPEQVYDLHFSVRSTTPTFLRFRQPAGITPQTLPEWAHKQLNLRPEDGLELMRQSPDRMGGEQYRFQQTYKGLPVEGGFFQLHTQPGIDASLHGDYFSQLDLSVTPTVSQEAALQTALNAVPAELYAWEVEAHVSLSHNHDLPEGKLVIANDGVHFSPRNFHLLWKFDIESYRPLQHTWVYVDAQTGALFQEVNQIMHVDAPGTANTHYSGTQTITADFTGSTYRLREIGRGLGIETFDLNQTVNFWAAVDFTDTDNIWNNINAQQDEVATDAHWGTEMAYDYLQTKFGRNSIDGMGYKLQSYVHYDAGFNNAYWDGSRLIFGDGDGINFNPLVCLDAVGHELAHGLTQYTSGLDSRNEAGALNEAFSDIFAVALDFHTRPTVANWTIADEAHIAGTGLRNLANPGALNNPDTYQGTDWDTTLASIHNNSTVASHWFYRMAMGGSGTNDLGNTFLVNAIGVDKASQIAYRTNTVYLSTFSDFADARFYSIQAAIDLFGACSPEVFACADAWYAVGVGNPYTGAVSASFTSLANDYCQAPAKVRFFNNSVNAGSFVWDFGDGNTSTQRDPVHTYTSYGDYTVTLIAEGGLCGNDTLVLVDYVSIDPNLPCNVVLDPANQNTTQYACFGTLFDAGGPAGDYPNQSISFITLAPTAATNVTLTFSQFNYQAGDTLRIFEGPGFTNLIGKYSGTTLPNGGTIVSTTGAVTILHRSDLYQTASGFTMTWSCNGTGPPQPPVTQFTAGTTTPCGEAVSFVDQSTGNPTSWSWDFGDGNTSTLQNPSHTYATDGTYTVSLVTSNAGGSTNLTKTNFIVQDQPVASIYPAGSIPLCPDQIPHLTASGGNTYEWSTGSTNPILPVSAPGAYSVIVESATGCKDTSASVQAISRPAPTVTIVEGTNISSCSGNPVTLTATGANLYQWSNSQLSNSINVTNSGNFYVIGSNQYGCHDTSAVTTVNFTTSSATIVSTGPTQLCEGSTVTLTVVPAGVSYTWSNGDTTSTITVGLGGNYTATVTDANGCQATAAPVPVTVAAKPIADFFFNVGSRQVNFADQSSPVNIWNWTFGDGTTSAVQNPAHNYQVDGTYLVKLLVEASGCSNEKEVLVSVPGFSPPTGMEDPLGELKVKGLWPNPFQDQLHFSANFPQSGELSADLTDLMGRPLLNVYNGLVPAGDFTFDWNVGEELAAGVYLLRVTKGEAVFTQRVVRIK